MDSAKKMPDKEKKESVLILAPLDFEQALENLLQVKPEKKTALPKKKGKPKTEK